MGTGKAKGPETSLQWWLHPGPGIPPTPPRLTTDGREMREEKHNMPQLFPTETEQYQGITLCYLNLGD